MTPSQYQVKGAASSTKSAKNTRINTECSTVRSNSKMRLSQANAEPAIDHSAMTTAGIGFTRKNGSGSHGSVNTALRAFFDAAAPESLCMNC